MSINCFDKARITIQQREIIDEQNPDVFIDLIMSLIGTIIKQNQFHENLMNCHTMSSVGYDRNMNIGSSLRRPIDMHLTNIEITIAVE
jgi:hypothetical protein